MFCIRLLTFPSCSLQVNPIKKISSCKNTKLFQNCSNLHDFKLDNNKWDLIWRIIYAWNLIHFINEIYFYRIDSKMSFHNSLLFIASIVKNYIHEIQEQVFLMDVIVNWNLRVKIKWDIFLRPSNEEIMQLYQSSSAKCPHTSGYYITSFLNLII